MKYAVTAAEMKSYDTDTIERIGLSSEVLMERAALSVVEELLKTGKRMEKILVVAGRGNNGGDGIAIGRILLLQGKRVDIYFTGVRETCTAETRHQLEILENLGFSTLSKIEDTEYDMIVDALFGIGLSRDVTGIYGDLIEEINERRKRGSFICAVDIASGICADTGKILGCGVKADLTVTFAFAKRGQLFYPGKEYTGKLVVKDIGITDKSFVQDSPEAYYYEPEDLAEFLPQRRKDGNKGSFGKVLVVAGSEGMSGACLLCSKAVFRMGTGMVKVITPGCNKYLLQQMLPEAMLYAYSEQPEDVQVREAVNWADAVIIGPGLSMDKNAQLLMKYVLESEVKPLVVDADGLNLLAENDELHALAVKRGQEGIGPMIFTPHPGELVRLCKTDMKVYKKDRIWLLKQAAETYHGIIVGKDAVTLTMSSEMDTPMIVNSSGTDGMATAGSGDVLAGVITALLAQGMEGMQAASLGVYIHGLAGEMAAGEWGRRGMLAGDIADALGYVLKFWEDKEKEDV